MSIQAISTSLQALNQDFERLDRSAQRLTQTDANIVQESVAQLNLRRDAQAQVKVIQAEDEMLGLLVDLKV